MSSAGPGRRSPPISDHLDLPAAQPTLALTKAVPGAAHDLEGDVSPGPDPHRNEQPAPLSDLRREPGRQLGWDTGGRGDPPHVPPAPGGTRPPDPPPAAPGNPARAAPGPPRP